MARILDTVFLGASPWQNGPPDLFSDLLQDWHDRLALPFVLEIVLPFRMAKRLSLLPFSLRISFSIQDGGFGPEQLLRHVPREPDLRNNCRTAAEHVQFPYGGKTGGYPIRYSV
jgi:hypothetical protein